jgi:hypothetical protein
MIKISFGKTVYNNNNNGSNRKLRNKNNIATLLAMSKPDRKLNVF